MMTWYKTTFEAPPGDDPVALDLQGLGKGFAWVNGNNIGRYWPSYLADENGCSLDACDYRGEYNDKKCVTNCGKPTQRWYHVPRSFMCDDKPNTLVLFEEFGGNPWFVRFQTVVPGSICADIEENKSTELSCQGRPISAIRFASFGDVQGACGSYLNGSCESKNDAKSIIEKDCVGKESCVIQASQATLGATNCTAGVPNRLVVEAIC